MADSTTVFYTLVDVAKRLDTGSLNELLNAANAAFSETPTFKGGRLDTLANLVVAAENELIARGATE